MSAGPDVKSGSNLPSKTSKLSSKTTSAKARSFRSTLKQAERKLHAWDYRQEKTLRSLFLSMTRAQRTETIGHLKSLSLNVGALYVTCLRIHQSQSSSKMASTMFPSYFGPME